MNPLQTRGGTVIAGILLAVILTYIAPTPEGVAPAFNMLETFVWFHVVVGVAWIGLLYYFNAVQVPAVAAATADGNPGPAAINKYVAPRALFWFRWAAVLTWLSGAAALGHMGIFVDAFTLANPSVYAIGIGAWLGTIMLFNVWVLIWPNQKKILGIVQTGDEEKAKARKVAFLASRTNAMLSIPMLLGMTAHAHGLPF